MFDAAAAAAGEEPVYMEADEDQRVKYDTGQVPGADAAATERRRANTLWAEPATYAEPDQETGAEYADVAVAVAVAAAGTTTGPGPAYEVPTGPDAEAEDTAGLTATRGFVRGGSVYAGFGSQQQGQQAAAGASGLVRPRYDSVLTHPSEAASRASVDAKGYVAGEGAAEGGGPVYVPVIPFCLPRDLHHVWHAVARGCGACTALRNSRAPPLPQSRTARRLRHRRARTSRHVAGPATDRIRCRYAHTYTRTRTHTHTHTHICRYAVPTSIVFDGQGGDDTYA